MQGVQVGNIYYTVSMDMAQMIRDGKEAGAAAKNTGDALKRVGDSAGKTAQKLKETARATREVAGSSDSASEALSGLGRTATKELSRLNDVAAAAKAVVGGMAVMNIIDIADEWGQYASRLKMATQSTDEYNIVQERMIQSANMTFRSINETKESFIKMSPVLRQMGYDLGESMDAVDTFSGLLVVNSASADRAEIAMSALSRSLQKGRVDADAWEMIYVAMPGILDVLTVSSGKTQAELLKLGADGKMSLRMLTDALVQGYLPTMQKVAEMPTSVRDAMQNLTNGFQEYIGKANEAAGITATIAKGLSLLGDNFSMVAEVGLAAAGGAMLSYAGAAVKAFAASLKARQASIEVARAAVAEAAATARRTQAEVIAAKHQVMAAKTAQEQAAALSVLHQAKLADVQATKVQEAANNSLAKSQALMRGAGTGLLGIMGGPAGIAVTAGLVAASFFLLRDKSKEAQASLDDLGGSAEVATTKFKALTKSQQESARLAADDALVKALADLDTAFKNLTDSSWRFGDTRRTVEWRKENAAAIAELIAKNKAGEISYEELNAKVTALAKSYADANGMGKGWVAQVMAQITALTSASQTAETAKNTVNNVAQANRELAAAANQAAAGVNNANAAMGGTTEAGQKAIAQLERQLALYGKAGSAAGYLYDIEQARKGLGQFAGVDPKELDRMAALAQQLAKLDSRRAAAGGGGKSKAQQEREEQERIRKQRQEDAKRYIESLQQQYDQVDKMTNLERLEYEIKAKKVTLGDEEYKTAVNLAEKLDERARKERELVEAKKAAAEALNVQNAELSAQRQLLSEIAGYDADIDGAGMGERARSEMEARLQIVQQFAQRVQQIDDQRRQALAQADEKDRERIRQMYDDVLRIEQDYQGKSLAAYDQYVQRKREADADWTTGASRAWANYVEQSQSAAATAEGAMQSWLSSTEDALTQFVQTGKLSFSDLANSIIADLARIAARQAVMGAVGSMMGGWLGTAIANQSSDPIGSFIKLNNGFASVPGRANGGPVAAGQMYEVNERGTPELLTYGGKQYLMMGNQSGNVTPMGSGGGGMQQHGGNVIVNIHGAPSQPQVQERTDSGGNRVIDVLFGQFEQRLGQRMAAGQGAAFQGLNSRVVLQPRR